MARFALAVFAVGIFACSGTGNDAIVPDGGVDATVDGIAETSVDGGATKDVADAVTDLGDDAARDADAGCPSGPFGGGVWPPACWRPFAATSFFNTKLPAAPKLMVNSASIVRRVLGYDTPIAAGATQIANVVAYDSHFGGWPTYWARASDPV